MATTSTHYRQRAYAGSAFSLENQSAYAAWRDWKLAQVTGMAQNLIVDIDDPRALTRAERNALIHRCRDANMAIYRSSKPMDKLDLRQFGLQLGLKHLDHNLCADNDSVSSIQSRSGGIQSGFIPYSDRPLNWHTDGYYNAPDQSIRAFVLHCVHPAVDGGTNEFLDPEAVYIQIREKNPDFIRALMHPSAMSIPACRSNAAEIRQAQSGPVFSVDPTTGRLHMRYTARTRSIRWRNDTLTRKAVEFLFDTLSRPSPHKLRYRLRANEGIVCNNVLHNRSAFINGRSPGRLMYRARYYERVCAPDIAEI